MKIRIKTFRIENIIFIRRKLSKPISRLGPKAIPAALENAHHRDPTPGVVDGRGGESSRHAGHLESEFPGGDDDDGLDGRSGRVDRR